MNIRTIREQVPSLKGLFDMRRGGPDPDRRGGFRSTRYTLGDRPEAPPVLRTDGKKTPTPSGSQTLTPSGSQTLTPRVRSTVTSGS